MSPKRDGSTASVKRRLQHEACRPSRERTSSRPRRARQHLTPKPCLQEPAIVTRGSSGRAIAAALIGAPLQNRMPFVCEYAAEGVRARSIFGVPDGSHTLRRVGGQRSIKREVATVGAMLAAILGRVDAGIYGAEACSVGSRPTFL